MGQLTFILGGARSGKSTHALNLAKKYTRVAFIATAEAHDTEMRKRIKKHQASRPKNWKTFEEPLKVADTLSKINNNFDIILIDCVTLLISNLMLKKYSFGAIKKEINEIIKQLKLLKIDSIIVSNETGLGIVPENKLARDFRDIAGSVNQIIAKEADEVIYMTAGIPIIIKQSTEVSPPQLIDK